MRDPIPALLVAHRKVLLTTGGGVQVCNRDYVALLEVVGFRLTQIGYEFVQPFHTRLLSRLVPTLCYTRVTPGLFDRVKAAIQETGAKAVFYSLHLFPELSHKLRQELPEVGQVLLSHGAESIDFVIAQRIGRQSGTEHHSALMAERMLGREIMDEVDQRRSLDAVLALSPFDVEIEKWLGTGAALWVPRTIQEPQLEWRPVNGRVGCVSTLDHPPNLDGLIRLFGALNGDLPPEFRFRVVGQPNSKGQALAARYPFVEYLGPLSDGELRSEAATWCCFVHPVFVYAKGCSTKLAVALGWGLPIATTRFGARGYVWDEAAMPLAETAPELAKLMLERAAVDDFSTHQQKTAAIVSSTPSMEAIADRVRSFLLPRLAIT